MSFIKKLFPSKEDQTKTPSAETQERYIKNVWREAFMYAKEEDPEQKEITPYVIIDIMHSRNVPYTKGNRPVDYAGTSLEARQFSITGVRQAIRDYMCVDFPDLLTQEEKVFSYDERIKNYRQAIEKAAREKIAAKHNPKQSAEIIGFPKKD